MKFNGFVHTLLIASVTGLTLLALTIVTTSCATSHKAKDAAVASAPVELPKTLHAAVTNTSYRTPENIARDPYRHPEETLDFFGIKPEMTVVEITPGGGWYTQILAPYLATQGHYIGAIQPAGENKNENETTAKVIAWLKSHHEFDGHMDIADFAPPEKLDLAPPESADMVVTFRNVHNWMSKGNEQAVFNAFFKALKHGGTLGIEEHRANPKTKRDPKAKSGYVLEKDVKAFAKKAGFKFVASSNVNNNPKDTKNYADGVWTLPPVLRLKDKDREKYLAIGESDRMTLKFVKP